MNSAIADLIRDEACTDCKMCNGARIVCQVGDGPTHADIMVVSKFPNSEKYQGVINEALAEAGIDPATCFHTQAIKCLSFEAEPGKTDLKTCKKYLDAEIEIVKPKWILAFGNEALTALLGRSGITKYRGRAFDHSSGATVIPTISPASVLRNPGQRQGWLGDIRFFASQVFSRETGIPKPKILKIDTANKLKTLKRLMHHAELLSYDIETRGEVEHAEDAVIVSLSGTMLMDDGSIKVWVLPLCHPQSPFRRSWRRALLAIGPAMCRIPKLVAHNGKFDARWLRYNGVNIGLTFDTMLAAHLLDENRQKGLKPQGTSRLGVAPWGIDTKDLWSTPLSEVLKYNALDTYYTYFIYLQLKEELKAQPRLAKIFTNITMPSCRVLIKTEMAGVWTDREKLSTNTKVAQDMIAELEAKIMRHVPSPDTPGWPRMGKRGKPADVNFNPSNWSRWWLFEHLGLPVLARGKDKEDGTPGAPSMAEAIMMELKPYHEAVALHLERTRWNKMHQFFTAYENNLDENDRVHTTFKLAGTVTGRLSSGKEDEEKFTAKVERKGINLQQVPRDPFVRGLFGAPPGYYFVEADFSQVELRVVAFIAREAHMMHLYQTNQDIHLATAANVLGVPAHAVTKEDRKKAKAVNFGFVYGMGWRKFIQTAWANYELVFTEEEAQAVRKAYFEQFPDLPAWHARQRRLVRKYKRVVSPIGRIRHLPDIDSPDKAVQGEAERQAINSPVQSFASDMTQLSMVMIDKKFEKLGLDASVIGTVHDASLFQVRKDHVAEALPIIKDTMQNLPLERLFGVTLDVPIIADLKVGTHWGTATELEEHMVYDWDERYLTAA